MARADPDEARAAACPAQAQSRPSADLNSAPLLGGGGPRSATPLPALQELAGRAAQLAVTADSDRQARASGRGTRPSAPPSAGRATVTAVVTDADQTSVTSTPRAGGTMRAAQIRGRRSTRPLPARPRRPRCLAASRPRPRQLYARGPRMATAPSDCPRLDKTAEKSCRRWRAARSVRAGSTLPPIRLISVWTKALGRKGER